MLLFGGAKLFFSGDIHLFVVAGLTEFGVFGCEPGEVG
jgi:hypothetical protein